MCNHEQKCKQFLVGKHAMLTQCACRFHGLQHCLHSPSRTGCTALVLQLFSTARLLTDGCMWLQHWVVVQGMLAGSCLVLPVHPGSDMLMGPVQAQLVALPVCSRPGLGVC